MVALNSLIETIETIEVTSHTKLINKKINDLETLLSVMIEEVKKNRIENVINTALELARNANELFLTITSTSSTSIATKPINKTTNV